MCKWENEDKIDNVNHIKKTYVQWLNPKTVEPDSFHWENGLACLLHYLQMGLIIVSTSLDCCEH